MDTIEVHFGIDFGTTNSSAVGYYRAKESDPWIRRRFEDSEQLPIPSFIAIDRETGEVYSGRDAWNHRMELAERCECVPSVKMIIDTDWTKVIAGKTWTACDVAAEVFATIKRNAKERMDADINSATVAIPIGFSPTKREVLRDAASAAGIEIEAFVSEPTAAYFANYNALRSSHIVAVFDWGGGTLDVSVIKHQSGKMTELATCGIDLGGDDIDRKIARKIHSGIAKKKCVNLAFEDMPSAAQDRLLVRAERAKRALSEEDDATVSLNNYGEIGPFRESITYEWFEALIEPEINRALLCLEEAIDDSGVGLASIDRIVMIGGSSNLRPLLEKMEEKYSDKLFFPEETIWNIGEGAGMLSAFPGKYYSAQNLGIILADGSYFPLLSKDAPLKDWNASFNFGITDCSREARVVFSGSKDLEKDSEKYWSVAVPQHGFDQETIRIQALVDKNMVFKAKCVSSMRPREFGRVWEYDRLKCYYRLAELEL